MTEFWRIGVILQDPVSLRMVRKGASFVLSVPTFEKGPLQNMSYVPFR